MEDRCSDRRPAANASAGRRAVGSRHVGSLRDAGDYPKALHAPRQHRAGNELVQRRHAGQSDEVTNIEIRQARPEDAESLQKNCKRGATLEQVRAQLEWTTRERAPHHLEHFVAVDGDEVIGTVMLTPRGGHAVEAADGSLTLCRGRNGPRLDICRLDDWVVTSERHGTGVGARLALAVLDQARTWGILRVESSSANPAAVRSLARCGFKEWGRFPLQSGRVEVLLLADKGDGRPLPRPG